MSNTHNTQFIGFYNAGTKVHSHARCGATRRNRVHNTPYLTSFPTEEDRCGRCGSGYTMADPTTIMQAWEAAWRHSQRIGFGMSKEYTEAEARKMVLAYMEKMGS